MQRYCETADTLLLALQAAEHIWYILRRSSSSVGRVTANTVATE
jgi:hypothetical protein